jgi:small subunit ribosomal protein S8
MSVVTDPISDFLTRVRNGIRAGHANISSPYSRIRAEIARILQEEGFIWNYEVVTGDGFPTIKVKLKYDGRRPLITDLKRVSSPGRRHYVGHEEIPNVRQGLGVAILSTSKGVMTGARARRQKVGGELVAFVW